MKNRFMFFIIILTLALSTKLYLSYIEKHLPRYTLAYSGAVSNWSFVEKSLKNLKKNQNIIMGDSSAGPSFIPRELGKSWVNLAIQGISPISIMSFISKIPDGKINKIILSFDEVNLNHNTNNSYSDTINPNSLPSGTDYFFYILPEVLKMKNSSKLVKESMGFFLSKLSYIFASKDIIKHYLPEFSFLHLISIENLRPFLGHTVHLRSEFKKRYEKDLLARNSLDQLDQQTFEEMKSSNAGESLFIPSSYSEKIYSKLIDKLSNKAKCVLLIEKAQSTGNIYNTYYLQHLKSFYDLLSEKSSKHDNVYFLEKPQVFTKEFFADAHHTNMKGGIKGTKQVKQYLEKVFKKCPN